MPTNQSESSWDLHLRVFLGGAGESPFADFQPIRASYSLGTGIDSGKPRDWSKTNGRPCEICCSSEKVKFLQPHHEVGTNVGHAQAGGQKRDWSPKPVMPLAWASHPPSLIIGGGFLGLHRSAIHCFRLPPMVSDCSRNKERMPSPQGTHLHSSCSVSCWWVV